MRDFLHSGHGHEFFQDNGDARHAGGCTSQTRVEIIEARRNTWKGECSLGPVEGFSFVNCARRNGASNKSYVCNDGENREGHPVYWGRLWESRSSF